MPASQEREKYEQQSRQLKEEALAKAAGAGPVGDEEQGTAVVEKKTKKVIITGSSLVVSCLSSHSCFFIGLVWQCPHYCVVESIRSRMDAQQ